MVKLEYSIKINVNKAHVWKTMLEPGSYEQWAKAFSEGSRFEGIWEQGATVRFVDPAMGEKKRFWTSMIRTTASWPDISR